MERFGVVLFAARETCGSASRRCERRRRQHKNGGSALAAAGGSLTSVGRVQRAFKRLAIFPAVDVDASGTRKEEILMGPEELNIVWKLRRVLHALDSQQALELLLEKMKGTKSNVEFLMQVQKTTVGPDQSGN